MLHARPALAPNSTAELNWLLPVQAPRLPTLWPVLMLCFLPRSPFPSIHQRDPSQLEWHILHQACLLPLTPWISTLDALKHYLRSFIYINAQAQFHPISGTRPRHQYFINWCFHGVARVKNHRGWAGPRPPLHPYTPVITLSLCSGLVFWGPNGCHIPGTSLPLASSAAWGKHWPRKWKGKGCAMFLSPYFP